MSLTNNTKSRKSNNNNNSAKFNIVIDSDTAIEFRPTGIFSTIQITTKHIFNILTQGIFDVTKENSDGNVNYTISVENPKDKSIKLVGFLNYYPNDLSNDSDTNEIDESINELRNTLSSVAIEDIHPAMTGKQATALLDAYGA